MTRFAALAALAVTTAHAANAGGVERSTQSVGILFETGRYAEFSFGRFSPDVSGSRGGVSSGDMAGDYNNFSFGYKMDLGDRMALAIILDQPIGADVSYPTGTGYVLQGTTADLPSEALTALLRYRFDNNVSLIGGVRAQRSKGTVNIVAPALGLANYELDTTRELDFGYVVGIAWEKPEIAARIALTYNSSITHDLQSTETGLGPTLESSFETEIPQSVNLEFQTGIAKDTLLFGSVRWVDWSVFEIAPERYTSVVGSPLVSYEGDRTTFTLGLGRRFNESWSGAVTVSYEAQDGETTGNLGPTDGMASIGLAATYTVNNLEITGGVRYVDIGGATTSIGAEFEDNSGIGVGVRIGYTF